MCDFPKTPLVYLLGDKMRSIEIIEQLLNGNHLEKKELERAKIILDSLQVQLRQRLEK